jgi:hypothetical protein
LQPNPEIELLNFIRRTAVAIFALAITTGAYAQGISPNPTGSPTMPSPGTPPSAAATPSAMGPGFGSGVGKVWVDTKAKTYHCPGGAGGEANTGTPMTEQAARKAGNRPAGGRSCF